jgi:carboxyl-terminal processing protease
MRYFERRPGVAQTFSAFLVVGVFAAGFVLGNINAITQAQAAYHQPPETEEEFAAFWQTYQLIRDVYVDPHGNPVETETLVNGAINGMVNALGDQFSGYMDPQEFPVINQELEGEFEGIGVVIRTDEETGEITVVSVLEGSPAQAGGIAQGDIFSAVDDIDVFGMTQLDLANVVRGPEGTPVKVTMRRGEELIDFDLVRAKITVPNVESEVLENGIGYIRLNQFSSQARTVQLPGTYRPRYRA